jgi:ABC-type multidrug transport system fused ATPase/permease subunit
MKSLYRIRILLQPYYPQIALSVLFLFSLTAIDMVVPEIIQRVIDMESSRNRPVSSSSPPEVILGLGLVRAGIGFGNRYTSEWLAPTTHTICATGSTTISSAYPLATMITRKAAS